jgi:hypothetical protein
VSSFLRQPGPGALTPHHSELTRSISDPTSLLLATEAEWRSLRGQLLKDTSQEWSNKVAETVDAIWDLIQREVRNQVESSTRAPEWVRVTM